MDNEQETPTSVVYISRMGLLYIIGRGLCLLYTVEAVQSLSEIYKRSSHAHFLFIRFHRGIVRAREILILCVIFTLGNFLLQWLRYCAV